MACPDYNQILDFVEHRSSPEDARSLQVHIDECTSCFEVFSELARGSRGDTQDSRISAQNTLAETFIDADGLTPQVIKEKEKKTTEYDSMSAFIMSSLFLSTLLQNNQSA